MLKGTGKAGVMYITMGVCIGTVGGVSMSVGMGVGSVGMDTQRHNIHCETCTASSRGRESADGRKKQHRTPQLRHDSRQQTCYKRP
jgi:hypothetical protein